MVKPVANAQISLHAMYVVYPTLTQKHSNRWLVDYNGPSLLGDAYCHPPQPDTCGPGLTVSRWSGSYECLQKVQSWVDNCVRNHRLCVTDSFVPKRLLDVAKAKDSVFLVEQTAETTSTSGVQYIALSHCWGKHMSIKTTSETYAAHLGGIAIASLPTTFRDAVSIARSLCIRYLWIDSLCIIQFDKADWAEQAGQMSMIYSSAYLTVAATAASDSSRGIFSLRDARGPDWKVPLYRTPWGGLKWRHDGDQAHEQYRSIAAPKKYLTTDPDFRVTAEEWEDQRFRNVDDSALAARGSRPSGRSRSDISRYASLTLPGMRLCLSAKHHGGANAWTWTWKEGAKDSWPPEHLQSWAKKKTMTTAKTLTTQEPQRTGITGHLPPGLPLSSIHLA